MKKFSLIAILGLFLSFSLQAQRNLATNLRADVDDEKVTFTFDVVPDGSFRYVNICLKSLSNSISPETVTGHVGKNKAAGNNLKLFWYYKNDGYTADDITNLQMDVIAINPLATNQSSAGPDIKPVPIYAGLGGLSALGGGLLIAGLGKESDAQDLYSQYEANRDPGGDFYQELGLTRDELYEEANSKHKSAQWMTWGGAAVFAGAGAILINRIVWMNRIKASANSNRPKQDLQCSIPAPRWSVEPVYHGGAAGVGIVYRLSR